MTDPDPLAAFLDAAVWHGPLEPAETLRAAHPGLADLDLYAAAVLGDAPAVRRRLAADPAGATRKGGPRNWEPLLYLCLSKYLRLSPERSTGFLAAAQALLDAGADPNTGFWSAGAPPEFETALYGAAGVAHHADLTRLLLARGADPNDGDTVYHVPEGVDNGALRALVETGRLTPASLAIMLHRKCDWHDGDGVAYLLAQGADPNARTPWGYMALHQALRRDNALATIERLLDHGADPALPAHGVSAVALAARRGRGDVLAAFERRGFAEGLEGVDRLLAACARDDRAAIGRLASGDPALVTGLRAQGSARLAAFAGTGNVHGVEHLLELGVDVNAVHPDGDPYFDIAPASTALHVAAWRAWPDVVRLLLRRGAAVNAADGAGRTPLMLAVRACVDSYWTERRTPDVVAALLEAGAGVEGVPFPSGYAEVDRLLRTHRGQG